MSVLSPTPEVSTGQEEAHTVVEVHGTYGDGGAYHFVRRGPSVTATLTITKSARVELLEVPEGFRPLTRVYHEPREYAVLDDGTTVRAGLTSFIYVEPDGTVNDVGGYVEGDTWGIVRQDSQQITLEWFTATEETQGEFSNLAEHRDGIWKLAKGGIYVRGRFSSSRSPVHHYAREKPTVLFTLPEHFRPAVAVTRTAVGQAVDAIGRPVEPAWTVPFRMAVSPDGTVQYLDDTTLDDVAYLAFSLDLSWETAVSPDRAVLDEIREALRSVYPIWNSNWGGSDIPLSEWRGVSTDAFGRVTHLELEGLSLHGHVPNAIGDLDALQMLHFGDNVGAAFTNQVSLNLKILCRLTNLIDLDLSWQPLEGHLPACWSQLELLKTLNLRGTNVSGPLPPEWATLKQLETIDLVQTNVSGTLPPEWHAMGNLERLKLSSPNLTGSLPAAWSEMASIRIIDIRGTPLRDPLPASWADMPRLEYLYLWLTNISGDIPSAWSRLANRTVVEIEGRDINLAALAE